jgi:glycosyltransferase involved in cell wall biosynthesis
MRVLVMCPVHDPRDARIAEREIGALLASGHEVTQAGPFSAYGAQPRPGVRAINIPRSAGRRRLRAVREARRVLKREASRHDLVLLHSPDAVLAAAGIAHPALVWDVHEDTAAALTMRPWMPRPLAMPVGAGVHWAEGRTERSRHILLAEHGYAARFRGDHPVVPNTPVVPEHVPPAGRGRVIYVGRITRARGGEELVALGRQLAARDIVLEVVGNADAEVADSLESAHERGWIDWRGFLPNAEALARVEGATAGISLLHDEPNYRHSMPTKLLEYLSRGVPFVSTPLPLAVDLAERSGGGVIVPFGDLGALCEVVVALDNDGTRRQAMADAGRAWVSSHANWSVDGPAFVRQLEDWSRG